LSHFPPFCRPEYENLFDNVTSLPKLLGVEPNTSIPHANARIASRRLDLSPNATFGLFTRDGSVVESPLLLSETTNQILGFAARRAIEAVHLRLPPDGFHQNFVAASRDTFLALGAQEIVDYNYFVHVPTWSESSMSKGNRKRLRQCTELGLQTYLVQDQEMTRKCFSVLSRNRATRGLQLSMTQELFERSRSQFPLDYELYATLSDGDPVAAAVVIRLNHERLYVLMWGHDPSWSSRSPVVHLFYTLMQQCAERETTILDLGISSNAGSIDLGLARFKTGLGARDEPKRTLTLNIREVHE